MPRLLLVDDNRSIHKIAETLLASTSVELVCVDSAEQALEMLEKGERFDVALLDTALSGMDGWTLLELMRKNPVTRMIPIAMMAGVLDPVNPERLSNAPVQGFIKKPVELRDLGDRVRQLLNIPVPNYGGADTAAQPITEPPASMSPFATMPATKLSDLPEMRSMHREPDLEFPHLEPLSPQEEQHLQAKTSPGFLMPTMEDDILVLTEEDLYPGDLLPGSALEELREAEPVVDEPIAVPAEEQLDLEELDLDSLRGFPAPPESGPVLEPEPVELSLDVPVVEPLPEPIPPEIPTQETPPFKEKPVLELDEQWNGIVDLPDLGAERMEEIPPLEVPPVPVVEEAPRLEPVVAVEPFFEIPEPPPADFILAKPATMMPEAPPLSLEAAPALGMPIAPPAAEPSATPAVPLDGAKLDRNLMAKELVEAIKSDPALLDALAKALVARMGDQVLREVAWDVMPDLAERLGRAGGS